MHPDTRPILISSDSGMVDGVVAVANEAGVDLVVAPDVAAAGASYHTASLVLLDSALADTAQALPRRAGLVVVSRRIDEANVWRRVLSLGAEHVVELPNGAPWLYERFGRKLSESAPSDVVVVTGSAGGVGATTLAAALAHHQERHGPGGVLVDLDPFGGGIDLAVGAEQRMGARWDELTGISNRVDEAILMPALPVVDGLPLLSWPPQADTEPDANAIGHVLDALVRTQRTVVVDAGRGVEPRSQLAIARASLLVLVVPLRVRAVAAATRYLSLSPSNRLVVVAREPGPGGLSPADLQAAVDHDVAVSLAHDRKRPEIEELGGPIPQSGAWRRVCERILAAVPIDASALTRSGATG